jgi:hypothetical protein
MPLFNWVKCTEGELKYINKTIKIDGEITQKDADQWAKVYDEYLIKYGLGKMYIKLLEIMRKKALLELEYVQTREPFKLTEIEIEEHNLKNTLNNAGNGLSIENSLIHLSKWLGYHINTKNITVTDYFNLLTEYGKAN